MDYIDAKTVIRRCNPNWDYVWHDHAMELYRGCTHGCIYCYARCSYYEKTDDFTNIRAKKNVLEIVRNELRHKVKRGVVLTGGLADCYNPFEKKEQLTRHALELLNAYDFGAAIITKSDLVVRDVDILSDITEHAPVSVNFTITCSDDELCRKIEPFVSNSTERFEALKKLSESGLTTGVLMDPLLPFINDTEENVVEMVKKAKYYGASYIYISPLVTMADIQRDYYLHEAEKLYPGYSEKFMKRYKNYYRCRSYNAKKLWSSFLTTCEKENMQYSLRAVNQRMISKYGTAVQMTLE